MRSSGVRTNITILSLLIRPFAAHLCEGAIKHLLRNAMVARGSQIYLEQSALAPPSSTEPLAVLKDKQAGDVRYRLLEVD